MRVILLERVAKLGQMGDIVEVKPGFARNFLIPNNKATQATQKHIENFKKRKVQLEAENLETKNEAIKIKNALMKIKPTIISQASEAGQLYGSVKNRDIASSIQDDGVSISKKQIIMKPLKTIGIHSVELKLHPEVAFDLKICVATNHEEASSMWNNNKNTNNSESHVDLAYAPQPSSEEISLAFEKPQNDIEKSSEQNTIEKSSERNTIEKSSERNTIEKSSESK